MQIVDGAKYLDEIKQLLKEYISELNRDLSFQNVADEYYNLKSKYLPPYGRILCVQGDKGEIVGCVAYHKHTDERCEMKRLYVKPEHRKTGAGRILAEEIISLAKQDGYSEMVLDTIKPLQSAVHLYKKLGFSETEPYYNNPMPDVIYFKMKL